MVKRSRLITVAIISGFIITGMAIFADRIGFDHNPHWGTGRIFALAIGILIVICTIFYSSITSKLGRIYFLAGLIVLLVIAVYVWFVSVGYWTNWPKTTNYFDMLATSFQHNQLSLQIKVDPALLAMHDPYDIYAREALPHITYLFDGSFYKGEYYLYWGPIPALILVPFKFAFPGEIGDQVLVLAFVSGLFIFQSLLMLKIWGRFFETLPAWAVLMGILLAGLITPTTWMLNLPRFYEASIESGQFFLIGGVYFAFTALDKPTPSIWRLVLTGIFWSFAVGSRNVLALPVIFMTLMTAFWIIRYYGQATTRGTAVILTGLILPLAIGAGLLGWYNLARFGSVLETGLRFQLSGINYREYYSDLFSTKYVLLNLRYYLFTPYKFIHGFPFIKPISTSSWPALSITAPIFYYAKERVSGLLYSSPFLLFAFIAIIFSVSRLNQDQYNKVTSDNYAGRGSLPWLSISLLGITAVSFITLLLYYYCTMRFVEDFIPALTLLAVLGFWQGYYFLSQRLYFRFIYCFISMGLATFTIVTGTLLGISSYTERFRYINPALFNNMMKFFAR
jgi:hypothetical protein